MKLANKIESLMYITTIDEQDSVALIELKKKLGTLNRLYIILKVPKEDRVDRKAFMVAMKKACDTEPNRSVKDLVVPDNLICPLVG